MRLYKTLAIVVSAFFIAILSPLSASSSYSIAETEQRSNPLDILSGGDSSIGSKHKKNSTSLNTESTSSHSIGKTIYLTFDDGPGKGTANVIHALRKEGVDGTMFFIGRKIENNRALYNYALSMPNLLIANHTYSHAYGKYENFYNHISTVVNDVDRAQSIIGGAKYLRLAGRNVWRLPTVYRNDYGLSRARRVIEKTKYTALSDRGYQIYGWDIEWHFNHITGNPSYGAEQMANRIEVMHRDHTMIKNGKIVLLAHDYMFRTQDGAQSLIELIQILKANGWRFKTISDYSKRTPEVFVRKQKTATPRKKIIRIAMSKKNLVAEKIKKQKSLLRMLR